jgi:hypothetical protein
VHPLVYPAMGLLALGILWLNTLLIAAAALLERRALGGLLARLVEARRAGRLVEAEVDAGSGPEGAFVTRTVRQRGRAVTTGAPDRILLTEVSVELGCHGGTLRIDGAPRPIEAGRWDVWLAPSAAGSRAHPDFDACFAEASTHKGLATALVQRVGPGARVHWLEGELLSAIDPVAALRVRRAGLLAFAALTILVGGVVTAVALVPPVFGTVSTIGGALSLLFFVLVQPAGVWVRNWARLPSAQPRVELWHRP